MYYRHQNYSSNQNDAYHRRRRRRRRRHHPYQSPSYYHQNPNYYHQNPNYHSYQNPRYYLQNPNYYHQNPIYHPYQNPSYYHQNPNYYHDQNYDYHPHQNSSYYHDQDYAYHRRHHHHHHHHHQHHHQNPSYDQIPHHHYHHHQQQHHHRNRFYDQNLSYYHQQQHHHRNRFYDQMEALHCAAASNPTRLIVKPKAPVVVVDFPVDVLILILARLPTKTLLKFRCVCKSWNSLIQEDHHFLSLHQLHLNDDNKKRPPPLITLFATFRPPPGEGLDCILNYSSTSSDATPYKLDFTRLQQDPFYCITNSCNGLLGVYSCNSFFIVNPTIRKLRPLPMTWAAPGSLPYTAAIGFDASTGVHKVLRMFGCEYNRLMPLRCGCEVYYLGGSGGWKLIDDPPVLPSCVSLPVVVDGAIIWASETLWKKHMEVVALSFDLREEKFSVIMHPEGSSRLTFPESHKSHVFASGGRICVADEITSPVLSAHMNIWLLMKDDKKNSSKWVKQYVIDLTYVFKHMVLFCTAQPLTTDHNGRIVISWGRGRKDYYDPRTGSFDKHELDARVDVEHVAPYTESMVWPWPS